MKYKRSILRGYDKVTRKYVAEALHMPDKAPKVKKRHLKGVRR